MLQFGGFYSSKPEIQKEKIEFPSLKGEADNNFDFPLQLDFLNSQENAQDSTPYFAPKGKAFLERISENEEGPNTEAIQHSQTKNAEPPTNDFSKLVDDLKDIRPFKSQYLESKNYIFNQAPCAEQMPHKRKMFNDLEELDFSLS